MTAQQRLAQQRVEAARARQAAARRKRRLFVLGIPLAVVVLAVAVLVAIKIGTGAGGPRSGKQASAASSAVVSQVTSVPANVLNAVGAGTASGKPRAVDAPPLTSNGKPEILYVGAEYCPFCATERWAVVQALSRFGTFTNLGETASSPSDVYPNTATLTFHGASYTSDYLSFSGKETQSNQVVNGNYAPLDTLSAADQAIFATYNTPPYVQSPGAIPFIDIGGKYLISGASYNPQVLHGKTHAQIAAQLSDPNSAIAKGVDGAANVLTAAICKITNNQPARVCQASGVTAAAAALNQ